MSLELEQPAVPLKSFVGPWTRKGEQLLLACGKCQRKLKHDEASAGLANLKKLVKKRTRRSGSAQKLIVVETRCLKVCPRRGVAICTQAQIAQGRGSIVRSIADVDLLVRACTDDAAIQISGKE